MEEILKDINVLSLPLRLLVFAGFAVATHLFVIALRWLAGRVVSGQPVRRHQKLRSIGTLSMSALIFTLYFLAIGLILHEFGVSLTAYLASASVIGLAIGFGSQGIVQDVVMGLTFIFSDLIDVGDLVEVSGQTGIVKAITMRFVQLENAMGAQVFIPNRTINSVSNYPRGYVRYIADVSLRGDEANRIAVIETATRLMDEVRQQFPGIFIAQPASVGRIKLDTGKEILRLKFRIWPAREQLIQLNYCQQLIAEISASDPEYKPWMVATSYEVEQRFIEAAKSWPWKRSKV